MQPLVVAADADGCVEEFAEPGRSKELGAWAIAHDAAIAHENDALDLGKYVSEVMRNQHQACAFSGKAAQDVAQFALGGEIERIRRLVKQ